MSTKICRHTYNPGVLLADILLKDFDEQRSSTTVNLLGAPGEGWGSPRLEVPSRRPLGSQMYTISKKLAKREKQARFPTRERAKYFGVASESTISTKYSCLDWSILGGLSPAAVHCCLPTKVVDVVCCTFIVHQMYEDSSTGTLDSYLRIIYI